MTFPSILFERPEDRTGLDQHEVPVCLKDLNLDQVIESITLGREHYDLKPFYHTPLRTVDAIAYRHDVFRDLQDRELWDAIRSFAQQMRSMREHLTQVEKLYYTYQKESWFLDAVTIYIEAIVGLDQDLARLNLTSRGFLALREYLTHYLQTDAFTSLSSETARLRNQLASVSYCLTIHGNSITVSKYDGEADYAAEVEETFRKFRQGAVKDYRYRFREWTEMNHIEAGILDRIALLYPEVFSALDSYCDRHRHYLDPIIAAFDREVQFYVAYLEYMRRFTTSGLKFCYPHVSDQSKEVHADETFDLALAHRLIPQGMPVVCNDFRLDKPERIFVVTGPNQGGKTTFARTFGQLHYLASLGCPVPGREAHLFLSDQIFTHFEREEDLSTLRGKLEDDLIRIHEILQLATPRSIVILNEIFTSTSFRDALSLSTRVLRRIMQLDCLCVCVTFLDELAALSETTVSMVSSVDPEDPTVRTYRIVRKPADGRAYAAAIAGKYGLTYERLKERIVR